MAVVTPPKSGGKCIFTHYSNIAVAAAAVVGAPPNISHTSHRIFPARCGTQNFQGKDPDKNFQGSDPDKNFQGWDPDTNFQG